MKKATVEVVNERAKVTSVRYAVFIVPKLVTDYDGAMDEGPLGGIRDMAGHNLKNYGQVLGCLLKARNKYPVQIVKMTACVDGSIYIDELTPEELEGENNE